MFIVVVTSPYQGGGGTSRYQDLDCTKEMKMRKLFATERIDPGRTASSADYTKTSVNAGAAFLAVGRTNASMPIDAALT